MLVLAVTLLLAQASGVAQNAPGSSSTLPVRRLAPPSVRDVTLHDAAEVVLRRFGTPRRRIALSPDTELGMGDLLELQYSGLKVGLNRPKGQSSFTVHEIHITSRRWPLSNGVAVGMSRAAILA